MNWLHEVVVWFTHTEAEIWWSMPASFVVGYFLGRWSKRTGDDN